MSGMASSAAVDEIVSQFELPSAALQNITDHFVSQLRTGLLDPSLPFQLPAFVTTIPDGSETGRFLSVDLGGTNCRICLVDLHGHGSFSVVQEKHAVPRHVMVNERHEPLFSWLAAQISAFAQAKQLFPPAGLPGDSAQDRKVPLGFTFSFTCDQVSLSSGTLLHWDKGWDIPSALGRDPCQLLEDALGSANVPVRVTALANDSVGTLLARAYTSAGGQQPQTQGLSTRTLAGIIVGTGTNAAYVERLRRVARHGTEAETAGPDDVMIVNTEWGCLDDSLAVLPRTRFDDELDVQSTDRGSQMLEKRVSGMYLGELFRLVVAELYRLGGVFSFSAAEDGTALFQRSAVDSSLLSMLADGSLDEEARLASVAKALALQGTTPADLGILQQVSAAIVTRAARLVGCALAAILIQSGRVEDEAMASPSSPPGLPKTSGDDSKSTMAILETYQRPSAPSELGQKKKRWRRFWGLLGQCLFPCWNGSSASGSCPSAETAPSVVPPPAAPSSQPPGPRTREQAQARVLDTVDIGITGSVMEFHPTFEAEMRTALREIPRVGHEGEQRIRTGVCKDGSAVGAALMAQAAMSRSC